MSSTSATSNKFEDGATVDAEALKKAKLAKGPSDGVRVLGAAK